MAAFYCVHSIMMEKLTQAGEGGGGGYMLTPFHSIYHAERADTLPLFRLYPYNIILWLQQQERYAVLSYIKHF